MGTHNLRPERPPDKSATSAPPRPTVAELELALTDTCLELAFTRSTLEADVATYRELCLAAFDALRALTVRNHTLEAKNRRAEDELRALREERLLRAGADDV